MGLALPPRRYPVRTVCSSESNISSNRVNSEVSSLTSSLGKSLCKSLSVQKLSATAKVFRLPATATACNSRLSPAAMPFQPSRRIPIPSLTKSPDRLDALIANLTGKFLQAPQLHKLYTKHTWSRRFSTQRGVHKSPSGVPNAALW